MPPGVQSPFAEPTPKLKVGISWLFLVTIVAAATALLTARALTLPAVINEINAWMGWNTPPTDDAASRRAHVTFLLMCYSAPLIVGLATRLIHLGMMRAGARMAQIPKEDEEFRMEPPRVQP